VDSLPVAAKSRKAPATKKQPSGNGKAAATENDDFKSFEDMTADYLEQWKRHSTVPARNGKGRVLAQTTMHLVQLAMVLNQYRPWENGRALLHLCGYLASYGSPSVGDSGRF
jgi:hypothetical protein